MRAVRASPDPPTHPHPPQPTPTTSLRAVSFRSDVVCTQGDLDDDGAYPQVVTKEIGDWIVGVTHGHQVVPWGDKTSLSELKARMKVDVRIDTDRQFLALSR